MRKIILRVEGGLGNQMFQYAFAKCVQSEYGGVISFDTHTYRNDDQRKLSLMQFVLNDDVISSNSRISKFRAIFISGYAKFLLSTIRFLNVEGEKKRRILVSLGVFYQEKPSFLDFFFPTSSKYLYLQGNWMSEKYFFNIKNILFDEFQVKNDIKSKNLSILKLLKKSNSVAVHIRRGDYASAKWAKSLLVCSFEYYEKAMIEMSAMVDAAVFFIFTNKHEDVEWIKKNYKFSNSVIYVDNNNSDIEDFQLMSSCKHFIISNSSYSWWGAYLGRHRKKNVIAPTRWNNGEWDMKDIYLDTWKLIDV